MIFFVNLLINKRFKLYLYMETIVIDINSKEDKKIFTSLAKRLKSGYIDEKIIMNTLSNLKHK